MIVQGSEIQRVGVILHAVGAIGPELHEIGKTSKDHAGRLQQMDAPVGATPRRRRSMRPSSQSGSISGTDESSSSV